MMNLKKRILRAFMISALSCSVLLTGCGPDAAKTTSSSSGAAGKPLQMFLLTGSTGGTYYPLGGAIANVWNKYLPDKVKVTSQASGASVENIKRVDTGEAQLAMAMNNIADDAWNGKGVFKNKCKHFRSIGVIYPEVFQGISSADSQIKNIRDLAGKRVAVGPGGSGSAVLAKDVFAEYGIQFEDIKAEYIGFGDAASKMKDGHLEANFGVLAVPASAIQDILTVRKVNLIEIKGEEFDHLKAKLPFITPFKIPAGTYGNEQDAYTISMKAALYCKDDLPEDIVYELVKAFYEKNADIAAAHAAGKYIKLETALEGITTPLHPGAVKYYKEKGIKIPDAILPKA